MSSLLFEKSALNDNRLVRQSSLVKLAVSRLGNRSALYDMANEILVGMKDGIQHGNTKKIAGNFFLGENDPGTFCGPPDDKPSIRFECSDKFDCGNYHKTFTCDDGQFNCGRQGER